MSEHRNPRFWFFAATALLAAGFGRWAQAAAIAALGACDLALGLWGAAGEDVGDRGGPGELELLDLRAALPVALALGVLTAIGLLRGELEPTLMTVAALAVGCWPGGLSQLAREKPAGAQLERGLRFLPVCGLAAVFAALLALFAGMPPPLGPLQVLWLALLARALLVALAQLPAAARQPKAPGAGLAGEHWGRDTTWAALVVAAIAVLLGRLAWQAERPSWRTVVFTTFVFALVTLALTAARPSLRRGLGGRLRPLLAVSAAGLAFQLVWLYLPGVGELMGTVPLASWELVLCSGISFVVPLAVGAELRSFHPPSQGRTES